MTSSTIAVPACRCPILWICATCGGGPPTGGGSCFLMISESAISPMQVATTSGATTTVPVMITFNVTNMGDKAATLQGVVYDLNNFPGGLCTVTQAAWTLSPTTVAAGATVPVTASNTWSVAIDPMSSGYCTYAGSLELVSSCGLFPVISGAQRLTIDVPM